MTSWRDIGLTNPFSQGKLLGGGFLLGFTSIAVVAALELGFGVRRFNTHLTAAGFAGKLWGAALTAVTVSVLEEILWRGAIFGALRKFFHWVAALTLTSVVFAMFHFLAPAEATGPIKWHSGLDLLPTILGGMFDWQTIIPGCLNLILVGVLLGLAYQRSGNLYFSMGLHAAWILALKSYAILTVRVPDSNLAWWGTAKLFDGWFAMPLLGLTLIALARLPLSRAAGKSVSTNESRAQ
jgi:membrane protease YdiL (CAAX protease family)